jgi:hypothetical protein
MSSKTSVGRTVHFFSQAVADRTPGQPGYGHNGAGKGPYVAVVTQVTGPYANLLILPPFGDAFHEGSVLHRDDEQPGAEPGAVPSRYWVEPTRV